MRPLNVTISDVEFNKFGLKKEQLSFTDLIDLVSKELMRQNLDKSIKLSTKYGLSVLSMEEISHEIKAVRQDAKNRS